LESVGARSSMAAVGNPYENAKAEGFFKTLKREEGYCHVRFLLNETSPHRTGSGHRSCVWRPDRATHTPIVPHFRTTVTTQKA